MCIHQILEIIKSLLPIILGVFLAYIAWQQMKTNKNKLKLDLFYKRIEVYTDTIMFIQNLRVEGVPEEIRKKFLNSKGASSFLFSKSPEIYELINKIHSESFKVTGLNEIRNTAGIPDDLLSQSAQDALNVQSWLLKQPTELRNLMNKYLAL